MICDHCGKEFEGRAYSGHLGGLRNEGRIKHGTVSGWWKHYRKDGYVTCVPCVIAWTQHRALYRAKRVGRDNKLSRRMRRG